MLSISGAGGGCDESLIERLVDEFTARIRRGERPDVEEFVVPLSAPGRRHPRDPAGDGPVGRGAGSRGGPPGSEPGGPRPIPRFPHRPGDRPRGHGGRLRGRAGLPGPARGPQGPHPADAARRHAAAAVRARGEGRGAAAPYQHRPRLRVRRARRHPVLRHAAHRGVRARCGDRRGGAARGARRGPSRAGPPSRHDVRAVADNRAVPTPARSRARRRDDPARGAGSAVSGDRLHTGVVPLPGGNRPAGPVARRA